MNEIEDKKKKLWNRDFFLMWQGNAVSVFGDVLYSISIGFWVYNKTGSTAMMGLMSSISMIVNMLFQPFAGAIIDRIDRKKIIVGMDFLRGVLMIIVGYLAVQDALSINMVLFTALIASVCAVFFGPAAYTTYVDLVPKSELVRAQSITSGTQSLINLVGKGVSGALLTFFGIGPMIIINGFSFLLSAFTEYFIRVPQGVKQGMPISVKHVWNDVVQGAKDAIHIPGLNLIIIGAMIANFLGAGYMALLLPLALQKGMTITEYGLFISASSLAALLAMAGMGIHKIKDKNRPFMFGFSFIAATFFTVFALLGHGFWWVTIFFFFSDIFNVIGNAILNVTMTLAIPRDKRATVIGFVASFSIGGMALSVLMYGFLAEYYDLSTLAIIGTIASLIPLLPIILSKDIRHMIADIGQS